MKPTAENNSPSARNHVLFRLMWEKYKDQPDMLVWCHVCYKIVGKQEELQDLFYILTTLKTEPTARIPNDFGKLWIGCIVDALGGDYNSMDCTATVTSFSLIDNMLTLNLAMAVEELHEFRHFLKAKYPSMHIFYQAEDCNGFVTNDETGRFFPYKYLLSTAFGKEYFTSLDGAIQRVRQITGKQYIKTEEQMFFAIDEYTEFGDDDNTFYTLLKCTLIDDDSAQKSVNMCVNSLYVSRT